MPATDYYDILGVAHDASEDEIKRAYRALARKHHPDVAHDKSNAEHRFKEINEAYEVLSDANKRAQYDRFGVVGNGASAGASGFGFGSGSFGDIFDMFFGSARGATATRRSGPERGADLRYDIEISLEEAFTGTTKEIVFDRLAPCDVCSGSGAATRNDDCPLRTLWRQRHGAQRCATRRSDRSLRSRHVRAARAKGT